MRKKHVIAIIVAAVVLALACMAVFLVRNKKGNENENQAEANTEEEVASTVSVKKEKDLVYDPERKTDCIMDVEYVKDGVIKPLILCVHGGYYSSGDKSEMKMYLDSFSSDDYVAASINYPLLPESTIVGQIESVIKAVDYLTKYADIYEIDTNHIIMLGFSSGAHIAVTAAEKLVKREGNIFTLDAVVDISGPTDYRYLIEQNGGESEVSSAIIDGNPDADILEELGKIDSTDNITDSLPRVLIIHGEDDKTVPCVVSERFYESLTEAGVDAELKLVGSMGHVSDTNIVIPLIKAFLEE